MKRSDAKPVWASMVIAASVALGGWAATMAASAAPPTVTPSPGYDARLQEQRAAAAINEPAVLGPAPLIRRHVRRRHHEMH